MVLFLLLTAWAEEAPADFVQEVSPGVTIDWTDLAIRVSGDAWGSGTESSRKAVEQLARRKVGPGVASGARALQVTSDVSFADLESQPTLADQLRSRVERWAVTEARYYASGRVHLVGELPVKELLKPWMMAEARKEHRTVEQPRFTGLIVDARGSGATPAFSPRVVDPTGKVLYDGSVWESRVLDVTPVVYVPDPAHPKATRAGADPLIVRASTSRGCDLVLERLEAQRFRTAIAGAHVLGEGTVVIVLDP